MREILLGSEQTFRNMPVEIDIENKKYWILKDSDLDSYRLVSRKCPHAGALVEMEYGEMVCPMHGWSFDLHSGTCLNIPTKGLTAYTIIVIEGMLFAQM
ncbi:Rieske 2Fe-2S domain-containing protein [Paenibacillus sp. N3.4]|uniref:Rieske (2Fe-2S) protein n=1 Tax=Paenibacillus sp. N3.4 TaxID=2603222 RepID=UPI0011CA7FFC|nr:Rieske 2Fe-2S domain-containing protein [Paenibacillus sp. N3.4]TXK74485.1 Rieske 2Fe-2S domain-containing protein [Paenibacillus sp. N3.4]